MTLYANILHYMTLKLSTVTDGHIPGWPSRLSPLGKTQTDFSVALGKTQTDFSEIRPWEETNVFPKG